MATHTTILAWKIPWTEKPGGLQSLGSQSRTQLSTGRQRKKENLGVIPGLRGRNVQKILLSRFHSCWEKR